MSKSLSDFLLDTDYTNIWETSQNNASGAAQPSAQRPFSADASLAEAMMDPGHSLPSETDIVKLAARAVSDTDNNKIRPGRIKCNSSS